ncbi:type II toxin-antitoxin system VapC family toxin [Labrys okinawensis]|uniref:type II toxin-antitoxin system VapC family toxin n=1 Tax=Labrys okinawensis TaxID=346911 RepID=UPI001AECCDA3|nr:hypothetical protein [Labrys okinawensis]
MNFELARALRRVKPQRIADTIRQRPPADLPFVMTPISAGTELLINSCVYIDILQGHTPASVDDLLSARIINHSTICLAELTHLFDRLDPKHPATKNVLREIRHTIEDIPGHRLSSPSHTASGEAGMLAGLVARLSDVDHRVNQSLLDDAGLYLQVMENGWTVLTSNIRDFDYFDQLLPADRVLFYEKTATTPKR